MKLDLQLLYKLVSFTNATTLINNANNNDLVDIQASAATTICDKGEENSAKATAIRKLLISQVLSEENNIKRIKILEEGYKKYTSATIKDIEASICWENVLEKKKYDEIVRDSSSRSSSLFSTAIFFIIIRELLHEMRRCNFFNFETGIYSIEMVNNLQFIANIIKENFQKFEDEIVKIVADVLLVHYCVSLKRKNNRKIDKIIAIIKKHSEELRILILPECSTCIIFNNMIDGIHGHGLSVTEQFIFCVPSNIKKIDAISCHSFVRNKAITRDFIAYKQPYITLSLFSRSIDMLTTYLELKSFKERAHKYTKSECRLIFTLYLQELSYINTGTINPCMYILSENEKQQRNSILTLFDNECRLSSFLIKLLPDDFASVTKWICYEKDNDVLLLCNQLLKSIADYWRSLLNADTETFTSFYTLKPEEKTRCFVDVLCCYEAYLLYMSSKLASINSISAFDVEACDDIIKIIESHIKIINENILSKNVEKYVELFIALKKLTTKTLELGNKNTSTAFCDYPHLIEFYEEYHEIGLHIGCIYNIGFLLGKSKKGISLWLYYGTAPTLGEEFYNAADTFIGYCGEHNYETLSYDKYKYAIFDHIVRCLVEMKHDNYDNVSLTCDVVNTAYYCLYNQNATIDDIILNFGMLEKRFWQKIYLGLGMFDKLIGVSYITYPIKILYDSKFVTITDIKRFHDACCDLSESKNDKKDNFLRSGITNRIKQKVVDKVVFDIIFNAFKLVNNAKSRTEDASEGINTLQLLFRSLNTGYLLDIENKISSEIIAPDHVAFGAEITHLVRILGVYALFEEVRTPYMAILRYMGIIRRILYNDENLSLIKKCGYRMMLEYCFLHDFDLKSTIKKPDTASFSGFAIHLSSLYEFISNVYNDSLIIPELLKFAAIVGSPTDDCNVEAKKAVIENAIQIFHTLYINCPTDKTMLPDNTVLADTISYCVVIFARLVSFYRESEPISKTSIRTLIDEIFSLIIKLSSSIEQVGYNFLQLIYEYENFKAKSMLIIDSLDGLTKWRILCSMISSGTDGFSEYDNFGISSKLLMIISNALNKSLDSETQHATFLIGASNLLKKFLYKIIEYRNADSILDDRFLLLMCLRIQQDKILLEIIGFKDVNECDRDILCYICKGKPSGIYVSTINCRCGYVSDFTCLLKHNLSKFTGEYLVEVVPVCSICKL